MASNTTTGTTPGRKAPRITVKNPRSGTSLGAQMGTTPMERSMKYFPVLDSELNHINSSILSTNLFASLSAGCASTAFTLWLTGQTISPEDLRKVASEPGVALIAYGWIVALGFAALFAVFGIRSFLEKGGIIKTIKAESRQVDLQADGPTRR